MSIRAEIDKKSLRDVDRVLTIYPRKVNKILNEVIRNHLELVKTVALENKPWKDRTGTLRAGHVVRQVRDAKGRYTSAWELVANPFLNPQKGKRVTMDYAVWLEKNGWEWFYPTVAALEGELEKNLKSRIESLK